MHHSLFGLRCAAVAVQPFPTPTRNGCTGSTSWLFFPANPTMIRVYILVAYRSLNQVLYCPVSHKSADKNFLRVPPQRPVVVLGQPLWLNTTGLSQHWLAKPLQLLSDFGGSSCSSLLAYDTASACHSGTGRPRRGGWPLITGSDS